jgi:hypothetical protein
LYKGHVIHETCQPVHYSYQEKIILPIRTIFQKPQLNHQRQKIGKAVINMIFENITQARYQIMPSKKSINKSGIDAYDKNKKEQQMIEKPFHYYTSF